VRLTAAPLSTFGGFGRPYGQRVADDSINMVHRNPFTPAPASYLTPTQLTNCDFCSLIRAWYGVNVTENRA
jgi:hypothetical protein